MKSSRQAEIYEPTIFASSCERPLDSHRGGGLLVNQQTSNNLLLLPAACRAHRILFALKSVEAKVDCFVPELEREI